MAVAKVIYKSSAEATPEVWMDTTQKTVDAGKLLSGETALKNDGTGITGNITSRTSSDMIASNGTVTAPAGYYASNATKTVASGTEGTPTATKGTVSNHSISVTPSVTNTAGYISGGTKTGTAVSVSASELVSGTKSITGSGTTDVTNYASASVAAGSATTPETTITVEPWISVNKNTGVVSAGVSQGSDITPTVVAGYVSSGTAGSVTASGSSTMQLNTQSATYFHPSTIDQTISNGKYLTGVQTFFAVEHNLTADKIASGFVAKIGDWEDDDCVASITGTHSVVPNLTDKTVTPSTETQIVTADTDTGSKVTETSAAGSHTAGATISTSLTPAPAYTFTTDSVYRLIGRIETFDSNGDVLEGYDVDGSFVYGNTYKQILSNSTDSYIRVFRVKKPSSSSTAITYELTYGQTATFGIKIVLEVYESAGYDGLDVVTVNPMSISLTDKTVSPGDSAIVVIKDTDTGSTITASNSVSSHTSGAYTSSGIGFSPSYTPTDNASYRLIGQISAIDSSNNVLESYDIDGAFIWNSGYQTIAINGDNAYIRKVEVTKGGSITCYLKLTFGQTATFGILYDLRLYEVNTSYDGLNSVTVNPSPYSGTLMKNYISRSSYFTDITWPEGLTWIGDYAFAGCARFNPSSLPSGVTSIGYYAFANCSNLALTSLPSGITSIGDYAFYYCSNLALTSLPSGIKSITSYTFAYCTNLALTSLPSGLTSIGVTSFGSCTNLALTNLPSGVTSINNYAFQYCTGLTSISCGGAITTLGAYAFNGSSSKPMQLASVSFPNMTVSSLTYVFGNSTAASACKLLAFADIGSTQSISSNAFANCNALQTLVLRRSDAICSLSNVSAFLNTPLRGYNSLTAEVYVPNDLISTYQTATNWSTLYNDGTITFKKIEGSDYELD